MPWRILWMHFCGETDVSLYIQWIRENRNNCAANRYMRWNSTTTGFRCRCRWLGVCARTWQTTVSAKMPKCSFPLGSRSRGVLRAHYFPSALFSRFVIIVYLIHGGFIIIQENRIPPYSPIDYYLPYLTAASLSRVLRPRHRKNNTLRHVAHCGIIIHTHWR